MPRYDFRMGSHNLRTEFWQFKNKIWSFHKKNKQINWKQWKMLLKLQRVEHIFHKCWEIRWISKAYRRIKSVKLLTKYHHVTLATFHTRHTSTHTADGENFDFLSRVDLFVEWKLVWIDLEWRQRQRQRQPVFYETRQKCHVKNVTSNIFTWLKITNPCYWKPNIFWQHKRHTNIVFCSTFPVSPTIDPRLWVSICIAFAF